MDLKQMLKSWLIVAFGVLMASNTASGIHYDSREALIIVVILLSACNVFLKPLLMLFSLPFIILTFGVGIWVINALLFLFVAALVSGFHIDSFGSALWGALVVSITSGVATLLFGSPNLRRGVNINVGRVGPTPSAGPQARGSSQARQPKRVIEDDADVIDI
ncbi:MAG: phage holin family protein [Opitutae bacterium]|jgi:putative membrane protein|nr:phage holin family protein [Opitutae bacterium]